MISCVTDKAVNAEFCWSLNIFSLVLIFHLIITLIDSLPCVEFPYQTHAVVWFWVDFVACGLVGSLMWSHTSQISVLPSGQMRGAWKNVLIHSGRIIKSIHYASLRPPDPPELWCEAMKREKSKRESFPFITLKYDDRKHLLSKNSVSSVRLHWRFSSELKKSHKHHHSDILRARVLIQTCEIWFSVEQQFVCVCVSSGNARVSFVGEQFV